MAEKVSWLLEQQASRPSGWDEEQSFTRSSSYASTERYSSSQRSSPSRSRSRITMTLQEVEKLVEREKNKRIRSIYEDEGIPYEEDTTGAELIKHFKCALEFREKSLAGVLDLIKKARNADLCFVVDSTGSMSAHIKEVHESIGNILDYLMGRNSAPSPNGSPCEAVVNRIRLSFVGYGDYPDPNGKDNVFTIQEFTDSESLFRQTLASARVLTCGHDIVEDVFGGLNESLQQDWSPESGTKVIFHIGDRPGHGLMYHNLGSKNDSYPNGDPSGLTPKILFDQMKEYGIDYYFGRILPDTDKMLDIFGKEYGRPIVQFDFKNIGTIKESVTEAITLSVSNSISNSTMTRSNATMTIRPHTLVSEVPDWDLVGKMMGTQMRFDFPDSIEDLINYVPLPRRKPSPVWIKVAEHPFANGTERLAYYAREVSYDEHVDLVVKESLHIGKGMDFSDPLHHNIFAKYNSAGKN